MYVQTKIEDYFVTTGRSELQDHESQQSDIPRNVPNVSF